VLPNSLPHPPVGFLVPQGEPRLPPRGKTFQVAVVKGELLDLVSPFLEKGYLSAKHGIFTASLLIKGM
jgi:hypothetical protein